MLSCFFLITNFGVWSIGLYGYSFEGLIVCYTLAIPFFGQTIVSTLIYAFIFELMLLANKKFEIIKIKKLNLNYQQQNLRKDLNGLRFISVIAVILYHSKISLFNSGFIGVDIFFVLSGFFITQILLNQNKSNSLNIFFIFK